MFVTLLSSKNVEDNGVTNILLMNKENCALKLVDEIILYYDARSKKHQITATCFGCLQQPSTGKHQVTKIKRGEASPKRVT